MPTINATSTLRGGIDYSLYQYGSSNQTENSTLNYSVVLTTPTGTPTGLQINYATIYTGTLTGTTTFDLQAFPKESFGVSTTVSFTNIRSILVENRDSRNRYNITVKPTGANGFTEPWNGSTAGTDVKALAIWQYSDPLSGAVVDGSNKDFGLSEYLGSGIAYSIVIAGVTG